jgi:O-antigen/teichoic acid export membrane protein
VSILLHQRFREAWERHFVSGRGGRMKLALTTGLIARTLSVGIAFITTPIILRYLGNEGYGLMVTITSVTAWLQATDLGLGLGLQNALTDEVGRGNKERQKALISTCAFAMFALAAVLAVVGAVLYVNVDWLRVFPPSSPRFVDEIRPTVLIVLVGFLSTFALGFVAPIYAARQELHIYNIVATSCAFGALCGVLVAVKLNLGLVGVTACSIGVHAVLAWMFSLWYVAVRRHGESRPSLRYVSLSAWNRIGHSGWAFLVIQVCSIALFQTDAFIITQLLAPEQVTPYAIAQKLFVQITIVFGLLVGPLWAAYGNARASADTEWIQRTHRRLIKWFGVAYVGVFLFVLLGGQLFFTLWVGAGSAPTTLLLFAMACYYCIRQWTDLHAVLVNGLDAIRPQAVSAVIHCVVTIGLTLVLIRSWGTFGVAVGHFLGYALVSAWFLPLLARRALSRLQRAPVSASPDVFGGPQPEEVSRV